MAGDIYARAWRPLDRLLHVVLPSPCLGCGRPLPARRAPLGLCTVCRGRLRPVPPGCVVCAGPLSGAGPSFPSGCPRCRARPPAFERLLAGWRYEPPLDAVIARLKFGRLDYLGGQLGSALAVQLGDRLRDPAEGFDLVVPVPLHWRRRLTRGYDQAMAIARPLAGALGLPLSRALTRRRATPPQSALGRADRLSNLQGAFMVRAAARIRGRRLLLVDDVATTCATLDAAAAALLQAGATAVVALVAARTAEPARRPAGPRNLQAPF